MENLDGEPHDGLESKEKHSLAPLLPPRLKFKRSRKLKIDRETGIEEGKKGDHSGSEVWRNDAVHGVEENFTCNTCDRRFSSFPSLRGHLRWHSARNPLGNSNRPISTTSHDSRRLLPLPAAGGGPAGVRKDDEVDLVKEAVYGLLLLASGDEKYKNAPSKEDEDEIRAWVKENHHLSAEEEPGSPSSKKNDQTDKEAADDNSAKNLELVMTSDTRSIKTSAVESSLPMRTIENARQSQEQLAVAGGGWTHKCEICGLRFTNVRSLGGHKKIHRKAQAVASVVVEEDQAAPKQEFRGLGRLNEITPHDDVAVVEAEEVIAARRQVFMCVDLNEIPPPHDVD